jgi:hemoglobin
MHTEAVTPSLYEKLGDMYSVATVVDRVIAGHGLNLNPLVDEAHHRVPPTGFKYLRTDIVCGAAPQVRNRKSY